MKSDTCRWLHCQVLDDAVKVSVPDGLSLYAVAFFSLPCLLSIESHLVTLQAGSNALISKGAAHRHGGWPPC